MSFCSWVTFIKGGFRCLNASKSLTFFLSMAFIHLSQCCINPLITSRLLCIFNVYRFWGSHLSSHSSITSLNTLVPQFSWHCSPLNGWIFAQLLLNVANVCFVSFPLTYRVRLVQVHYNWSSCNKIFFRIQTTKKALNCVDFKRIQFSPREAILITEKRYMNS